MYEIIPSPGTENKNWQEIKHKIQLVKPFVKTIHIDIVDGNFAPNTTFSDPNPFKEFTDELLFEVHLMVEEPIQYLKPFADAGFKRFIGQVEKMSDQVEFVAQGQILGEVMLAVDGPTSLDAIKVPYDDLDGILCMTITAGFSGQKFNKEHLEKVQAVRGRTDELKEVSNPLTFPIEVDGGINDKTILLAKEAGATRFITTSHLFGSENPRETLEKLQSLMEQ